ncbi:m7GpppX diphosphatase [Astathelohania contejeani]|uniref:M7GpppX diphosphatase n=1 Tax=Astathelohania contejeani TaxID=164912 RepID=A0ABQ7HW34_9MICR|nr:m7GpppX diphosphatase [Thelohania contejeani]
MLVNIKNFKLESILLSYPGYTVALGKIGDNPSLLTINSPVFDTHLLTDLLANISSTNLLQSNASYANFNAISTTNINMRLISPASQSEIDKYSISNKYYITETPDEYENFKTRILENEDRSNWITNIIKSVKTTESKECTNDLTNIPDTSVKITEDILFTNDEIIIINDYKWDKLNVSNLYLLVLFRKFIYTIREINDIGMLIRAKEEVYKYIGETYGLENKDVIMFFHYRPTYYSLHLHVVNTNHALTQSMVIGRAVLLDDVIENLKHDINYYKKRTLYYLSG